MDAEHIIVKLPNELAAGEPGDPLLPQLISIIRGLAVANYWPLDFGDTGVDEDLEEYTELIFCHADSLTNAVEVAEEFIKTGGFVGIGF